MTVSGGPPFIRRGLGWRAVRPQARPARALLSPIPAPFTQQAHRDPLTGRWAKLGTLAPAPAVLARSGPRGDAMRVTRYVTEFSDGSREVSRVKVRHVGIRAARARGLATAQEVREFERGLEADILASCNPRLAASVHAEQMREAHNSDKGRRGARSKKRNQAARDAARPAAPDVQVSAAIQVGRADLLAMLAQLPESGESLLLRVRKVKGRPAELQASTGNLHLLSIGEK